ncbi:MAG: Succinyl-CoA ligase [ADP-forming] subunit beta [Pseudomonadota bacterium]
MLLIESDGKALFRRAGIETPASVLVRDGNWKPSALGIGEERCLVKAQVPVGGRGKAGGIVECTGAESTAVAIAQLLGARIKGHTVQACLVERFASGAEHYLALMADPAGGGVRLLYSPHGGMQVEAANATGLAFDLTVEATLPQVLEALAQLEPTLPPGIAACVVDCGKKLAACFFAHELLVAEINPLFIEGGKAVAGDAKVVIDLNAIERQPALMEMIRRGCDWYPDAWHKVTEDYDFIEIDAEGDVALVTTGAGLSMMLLDELIAAGARPYNFSDVRTGQMRGSPARLLQMMRRFEAAGTIKVMLINVFAGITDLSEFARIIVLALEERPDWNIPIVARLIGNNAEKAREILSREAPQLQVVTDLDDAIDLARTLAARAGGRHA